MQVSANKNLNQKQFLEQNQTYLNNKKDASGSSVNLSMGEKGFEKLPPIAACQATEPICPPTGYIDPKALNYVNFGPVDPVKKIIGQTEMMEIKAEASKQRNVTRD